MQNNKNYFKEKMGANTGMISLPKFSKKISADPGVALTEAMVAIAIIATAIVGILALLTTSLRQVEVARSHFVASQLALEGIEIVRSIRDDNWVANQPRAWNAGLDAGSYWVDFRSRSLTRLGVNEEPGAFILTTRGQYMYPGTPGATGNPTTFRRQIIIENIDPNEIRVVSRVTWSVRDINFRINTESRLFNFLQAPPP